MMSSYSFRRYHYSETVASQFGTERGTFKEMCDLVCAVAYSAAEVWAVAEQVEIEMRVTDLNPLLQFSCCVTKEGDTLALAIRERALMGHILRFYAARHVEEVVEPPRQDNRWVGSDWLHNNPSFILHIQQPSMHEKMEAINVLRDWLGQHWPAGAKHLARVV